MPDIAVLVERLIDDLVGLANKRRRRDDVAMPRALREFRIRIDRVVVAQRQRKIADRCATDLLRRRVGDFAADPGFEIVRYPGFHPASVSAVASTAISAPVSRNRSQTTPVAAGEGGANTSHRNSAVPR